MYTARTNDCGVDGGVSVSARRMRGYAPARLRASPGRERDPFPPPAPSLCDGGLLSNFSHFSRRVYEPS